MKTLIQQLHLFTFISLFTSLFGCASGELRDTNTPEGAFKAAEDYEKDELYEESLAKFGEVKNRFPYSKFAAEAELKIADIHFKREAWIEAQNNYQLFMDLHPKHSKIPYVTHRLGMSFFNQLPSTIDRDLTMADKAIVAFDTVIKNYPKSEFVEEARTKKAEARRMLGEKVLYIAEFYFIRDVYDSALLRYERLLAEFSAEGFAPKALVGAGISAFEVGDKPRAEKYMSQLSKDHPGTPEAERVPTIMRKYGVY